MAKGVTIRHLTKNSSQKMSYKAALFMAVIGIGLIAIGWFPFLKDNLDLYQNGVRTQGVVVAYDVGGSDSDSYQSIVQFYDEDGYPYRVKAKIGTSTRPRVGATTDVFYDISDPSRAVIYNWTTFWLLPGTFIGLGVILTMVGIYSSKSIAPKNIDSPKPYTGIKKGDETSVSINDIDTGPIQPK